MAPIVSDIDIARPPDGVFAYATDPLRFKEWQRGIVGVRTEGTVGVGGRCIITRRIAGSERSSTSEITEFSPPAAWAVHGIDGPIRADVKIRIEPRGGGSQSHLTINLDFAGFGVGKMILPMVVRQARKEVPQNCQKLKELLERVG